VKSKFGDADLIRENKIAVTKAKWQEKLEAEGKAYKVTIHYQYTVTEDDWVTYEVDALDLEGAEVAAQDLYEDDQTLPFDVYTEDDILGFEIKEIATAKHGADTSTRNLFGKNEQNNK